MFCLKTESALPMQAATLACGETSCRKYAELRAVVRADICAVSDANGFAEKMAPMQNQLQIFVQKVLQSFVRSVVQKGSSTMQQGASMLHFVSIRFRFGPMRYKIAPMQKNLQ